MIVLKETGQFATFFDRYRVDRPRNACQLFWYTLGASAVFTGAGVVAGLTLIGWVMWFFPGPLHPAEAVAMIVTLVGIIIGVMIYHDRRGIPYLFRQVRLGRGLVPPPGAGDRRHRYCRRRLFDPRARR